MMLHRLWRRGLSILVLWIVGTSLSHALASTHTPGTSQLGGWVYVDRNNDGILAFATDVNPEFVIPGVEVRLFSQVGSVETLVETALTDNFGRYFFEDLSPGTYTLRQTQPVQWVDGLDTLGVLQSLTIQPVPGSASAGVAIDNAFINIVLTADLRGDFYNFGELGLGLGFASKRDLILGPTLPFALPPPVENRIPEPAAIMLAAMATGTGCLLRRRRRN